MAYSYYKLKRDDVIHSRLKTHPKNSFWFYSGSVYHNNDIGLSGSFADPIKHLGDGSGSISLYEINIDRPSTSMISSSIEKSGQLTKWKTVSTSSWADSEYGDILVKEYPLTASISIEPLYASTDSYGYEWLDMNKITGIDVNISGSRQLQALRNTLNIYTPLSPHYSFDYKSSDLVWSKEKQGMSLIKIPSIFYGSSIKKGSVRLKYYHTGTLAAELNDQGQNGELIQTYQAGTTGTGSVAGVVLYNEGFILLTGSWNFTDDNCSAPYLPLADGTAVHNLTAWRYFGFTGSTDSATVASASSFYLSFEGTNYISNITINAMAPMGELNYSNNLTALEFNAVSGNFTCPESTLVTNNKFIQSDAMKIKAINKSPHDYHSASYKSTTYISKVGIYDINHNLIAITKLATPIRKREQDDLVFRMKLDI